MSADFLLRASGKFNFTTEPFRITLIQIWKIEKYNLINRSRRVLQETGEWFTLSSTGFCGKFLLAMRAVCWRLHWSREENLDWYSDQRWSTSWWEKPNKLSLSRGFGGRQKTKANRSYLCGDAFSSFRDLGESIINRRDVGDDRLLVWRWNVDIWVEDQRGGIWNLWPNISELLNKKQTRKSELN